MFPGHSITHWTPTYLSFLFITGLNWHPIPDVNTLLLTRTHRRSPCLTAVVNLIENRLPFGRHILLCVCDWKQICLYTMSWLLQIDVICKPLKPCLAEREHNLLASHWPVLTAVNKYPLINLIPGSKSQINKNLKPLNSRFMLTSKSRSVAVRLFQDHLWLDADNNYNPVTPIRKPLTHEWPSLIS
jgi:hypothetical protein